LGSDGTARVRRFSRPPAEYLVPSRPNRRRMAVRVSCFRGVLVGVTVTMPADLSRHPKLRNWRSRPARNLTSRCRYALCAHSSSDSCIPRLILKVRSVDRSLRSSRCFPDSLLFSIATSHQCLLQRDGVPNRGAWGAVADFDSFSTQHRGTGLPELGDDAFPVSADLALKVAKVMVHLERQNANHPHRCAAHRARRL
jgi:hypothetical protein